MEGQIIDKMPVGKEPVLRVKARPNDANINGDIFGGWLMSEADIAGAIVAAERAKGPVVTVAVKDLIFIKPLYVYDLVSFYGEVTKVGRTSVTVHLTAFAQRYKNFPHDVVKVSEATFVYVAVTKPGEKRLLT